MDELREKIANRIFASGMLREREGGDAALWEAAQKLANFITDIPEIASALKSYMKNNATYLRAKSHSISTGTRRD